MFARRAAIAAWAVAIFSVFVASPLLAQNTPPGTAVGVSAALYFEDTDLNRDERIAVQKEQSSQAYSSEGFLTGSVWFLYPLSDRIRAGSQLEWYGTWTGVEENDEEDGGDEDPETYEFGRLLELFGRFEYNVPIGERYDLYFGGIFGVPILFPGGDFQEEIDEAQNAGLNVVGLPRIGFLVGPAIGFAWEYLEYLSLRADLVFKYEKMFLFLTNQTVEGVGFQKEWDTSTFRWELNFGIEVAL